MTDSYAVHERLYNAARDSDELELIDALSQGADINWMKKSNNGWTPLHIACSMGHTRVVKCLIDHHANVNCKDEIGGTPLHTAALFGFSEVVRLLMLNAADGNIRNKYDLRAADMTSSTELRNSMQLGPLYWAIASERMDKVESMLRSITCHQVEHRDFVSVCELITRRLYIDQDKAHLCITYLLEFALDDENDCIEWEAYGMWLLFLAAVMDDEELLGRCIQRWSDGLDGCMQQMDAYASTFSIRLSTMVKSRSCSNSSHHASIFIDTTNMTTILANLRQRVVNAYLALY